MDSWVSAWMGRRKERGGGREEGEGGGRVGGRPGDTPAGSAFRDLNDMTQGLRLPDSYVQPTLAPQIPGLWVNPTPAPRGRAYLSRHIVRSHTAWAGREHSPLAEPGAAGLGWVSRSKEDGQRTTQLHTDVESWGVVHGALGAEAAFHQAGALLLWESGGGRAS